jgi:hypothetical protein
VGFLGCSVLLYHVSSSGGSSRGGEQPMLREDLQSSRKLHSIAMDLHCAQTASVPIPYDYYDAGEFEAYFYLREDPTTGEHPAAKIKQKTRPMERSSRNMKSSVFSAARLRHPSARNATVFGTAAASARNTDGRLIKRYAKLLRLRTHRAPSSLPFRLAVSRSGRPALRFVCTRRPRSLRCNNCANQVRAEDKYRPLSTSTHRRSGER